MKKIALVSCYFQPNYGSMLQAYASQYFLDTLNIPNETISINGFKNEIKKAKIKFFMRNFFSLDIIKDKLGFITLIIIKTFSSSLRENFSLREKAFKNFENSKFRLSEEFLSKQDLSNKANQYSAFLVGSDQLWLPSNIFADYYTLNFVPNNIRKISYATSFGVSFLPQKTKVLATNFLKRIDFLSVREKSGQNIIKELSGLTAEIVCDPTLLLTAKDWNIMLKNERFIKEPYIFCYFLGNNKKAREFARELKKSSGFKIVSLIYLDSYIRKDKNFADETPFNVDPSDFVNLVKNAEYICTDSFHGTVFSIINHKEFFTFRRFEKKTTMSTNNRIDSLLSILDLTNRIQENNNAFEKVILNKIDYVLVEKKLEKFRLKSIDFLQKSLSGVESYFLQN